MAKTEEELKALKERVASLADELKELSEDELEKVSGGGAKIKGRNRVTDPNEIDLIDIMEPGTVI